MDSFLLRYFPLFIAAVFSLYASSIRAQQASEECTIQQVTEYGGSDPFGDGTKVWNKSPESVCNAIVSQYRTFKYVGTNGSGYICVYDYNESSGLSGESVSALSTRVVEEEVCPMLCADKEGLSLGPSGQEFTVPVSSPGDYQAPSVLCNESCHLTGSSPGIWGKKGDQWHYYGFDASGYKYTGQPCAPDQVSSEPVPPACPKGQCPGTVNAQSVCVKCDLTATSDTKTETTTTTNPDGSTTTGSQTTTTTTTCTAAGSCTTTTTVNNVSGGGGSGQTTTTTDETSSSFCKDNPTSPMCKEGSWGGNCSAGFQCDGDPVQCAIAREMHSRNCELFQVDEGIKAIGESAISGEGESDSPANNRDITDINLSSNLDSTPIFGNSQSCPVDFTTTISGRSFTIPFSSMCPHLRMIGAVFVAVCYIIAAFIIFRKS